MKILLAVLALGAGAIAVVAGLSGCGGGTEAASAQTVRFQKPGDSGPSPFTKPADVRGKHTVRLGKGPFGGTGSDLVCDRELLIRSLRARPSRLREWARVRGITPTSRAVARYIRRLKPVTLTRDTRVTNYTFVNGTATGFQAILARGTAVLVDKAGRPVARCRCGNPLTPAQFIPTATCIGCPPNYKPPPPCTPPSVCWRRYPDPPPVIVVVVNATPAQTTTTETTPQPAQATPSAFFTPRSGQPEDTYTLHVSGFPPNTGLTISLTRPDGVHESYSLSTNADGDGAYTFPHANNPISGTYTATISGGGASASASTTVAQPQQQQQQTQTQPPSTTDSGALQCNPPRSQLESEQCAAQGQG
jgi:hypothetical protein